MTSYISVRRRVIKRKGNKRSKVATLLLMAFLSMIIPTSSMVYSNASEYDFNTYEKYEHNVDVPREIIIDNEWVDISLDKSSSKDDIDIETQPIIENTEVEIIEEVIEEEIVEEVVEEITEEVEVIEPEPEVRDYSHLNFTTSSNINNASGLTLEEVDIILDDYPELEPYKEAFYSVEQDNNVNVLFAMAVSILESGHGESRIAQTKNNLFGFMYKGSPKSYDSKEECIDYFGRLIRKHYIAEGLTTPSSISYKYEPADPEGWSRKVTQLMNQMVDRLE